MTDRRMVMVDDDLWEEARVLADELSKLRSDRFSISALVRQGLRLAIDRWRQTEWEGPFPQGESWIGFDLDGTLVHYEVGNRKAGVIGRPIGPMVERLKQYRAAGRNVAIVTARVTVPEQMPEAQHRIEAWSLEHLGEVLPVTCRKDYGMVALYDDRAIQVIENTGDLLQDLLRVAEGGSE